MDIDPIHPMPLVKQGALFLGFQAHFILAGLTDQYQSLDRAVFGCLKATVRDFYSRFVHDAAGRSIKKSKAVEILSESWRKLSRGVLEAAWAIFEEQEPPRTSIKPSKGRGSPDDSATPRFSLYEAISIEGVMDQETEMKRFVGLRRIIQHVVDTTTLPAREVPKLVRNAVVSPIRKRIPEASKDSDALTTRGKEKCKMGQEKRCHREWAASAGGPWMDRNGHAA
jgi:hypothetical protein